tara:strand:- start:3918 stop:4343 length:426 start_codon:yes stop_codon:yes gene_type:complete
LPVSISEQSIKLRIKNSSKKRKPNPFRKSSQKDFYELDKATVAAHFELKEKKRDLIYSSIALAMKIGLLTIFAGSFVRLGVASHQRIMRNIEISSVLNLELKRLDKLNQRFDRLFSIGGKERLIADQDHLITPNSFRVVWK